MAQNVVNVRVLFRMLLQIQICIVIYASRFTASTIKTRIVSGQLYRYMMKWDRYMELLCCLKESIGGTKHYRRQTGLKR
jgi:hypothetical protein